MKYNDLIKKALKSLEKHPEMSLELASVLGQARMDIHIYKRDEEKTCCFYLKKIDKLINKGLVTSPSLVDR